MITEESINGYNMDQEKMTTINQNLVKEVETRVIECGIHRIIQCLGQLDEEQLHYRPNGNSNSVNTQVLHLDGNVRQWLISTMSDVTDSRKRQDEFDPENKKSRNELIEIMRNLETSIRKVYSGIEKSNLLENQAVQCYTETNLSIIIHVIEHFSYHVGQITYITKMLKDIDTGYYADQDLTKVN